MKIILVGGGTGGSVAPLLAIAETIKTGQPEIEFLFIGTMKEQPEKEMLKNYQISFRPIFSGKLRRYFSWQNFLDPFLIFLGFCQSLFIIKNFRPSLIVGAGGYVSVPVILAGWFLKIPSLIHQQDIIPNLTNKILIPFVRKITVSFEKSLDDFPKNKTVFTGNLTRKIVEKGNRERAIRRFNLEKDLPTLLVLGGGTGAHEVNKLIWEILPELTKFCQIIHLAGKGKAQPTNSIKQIANRYYAYEFLTDELADAYFVADLVISRAGMNILTELSFLKKVTIIIPLPDSPQVANAVYFAQKEAGVILDQNNLTGQQLLTEIKKLLENNELRKKLQSNISKIFPVQTNQKIIQEIMKFLI